MKQRGSGSRLSTERRAVSALPASRSGGDRELATKSPRLRKAPSSAGSGNRGGLSLSCGSDVFHNWLSRASSAVSVRSNGRCSSRGSVGEGEFGRPVQHRRCQSSCDSHGRQTRASMLRMSNSPIQSEQPNRGYPDMIKRRKEFTRRCKSLSASHVRCKTLPDGEPLHAFITGARYNRAHNMDSRSLERVGVYIPRRDATRSFVNHAGTLPPSTEIYGGVKSRMCISDSNGSHVNYHWPMSSDMNVSEKFERSSSTKSTRSGSMVEDLSECAQQQQQMPFGIYNIHSPHYHRQNSSLLIRGYHGNQVKGEMLLSPSQRDGVTNPCGQRPLISMKALSNARSPGRRGKESLAVSHDLGECATSRNEELHSSDTCDVASSDSSDLQPLRVDHKRVNIENSNSPQNSNSDPPTTIEGTVRQTETSVKQQPVSTHREEGERDVLTNSEGSVQQRVDTAAIIPTTKGEGEVKQHTIATTAVQHTITEESAIQNREDNVFITIEGRSARPQHLPNTLDNEKSADFNNEDSEDELISPEARALINDEILKECQQSTSSFTSSSVSQEMNVHDNGLSIIDKHREIPAKSTPTLTLEPRLTGRLLTQDVSMHVSSESDNTATLLRQSSNNLAAVSGDLQAGPSEVSVKSSCIFVDMSTLNLDQVQADDEIDQSSND